MSKFANFLVLVFTVCIGQMAVADTFSVGLGKTKLGQLSYSNASGGASLRSTLDNTPLGVFNGTFSATSRNSDGVRTFDGLSKSSRKNRRVQVSVKEGRVVETLVEPVSEMTPLSDPTRVPEGTVDPVQGIGKLIHARTCPKGFTIYDGRRAIALIPTEKTTEGDTEICSIAYKVIAGPGHLSPLKISNAKMKLTYVTKGSTRTLARIDIASGIFKLALDRMK
ncbi:MAG: hypothetical protein WBB25_22465 [Sulfitobacter sp.]